MVWDQGQLLDIVAIAHSVVAEDVAEFPEFLDDRSGTHGVMVRWKPIAYNRIRAELR
jgi:hypothetical protein